MQLKKSCRSAYITDGIRIELQYKILMMSMTIKTNDQIW